MAQRVVAFIMVTTGLWFVVSRWSEYQYAAASLGDTAQVAGLWTAVLAGLLMFVPVLKIGAAAALCRTGRVPWYIAFIVLAVDVLALTAVSVHFILKATTAVGISELNMSGSEVVQVHSMWPIYAVDVLSVLCLVLLTRKATRERYFGIQRIA